MRFRIKDVLAILLDDRSLGVKYLLKKCPGRVCRVVIDEGSFIQHRKSISGKTVIKRKHFLIRGVIHKGFYCSSNRTAPVL